MNSQVHYDVFSILGFFTCCSLSDRFKSVFENFRFVCFRVMDPSLRGYRGGQGPTAPLWMKPKPLPGMKLASQFLLMDTNFPLHVFFCFHFLDSKIMFPNCCIVQPQVVLLCYYLVLVPWLFVKFSCAFFSLSHIN